MLLWNTLFALSLLGVVRYGDYITNECPLRNYACPRACDVDHKHYPRKECEDVKRKRNMREKGWKEKEAWEENNSTKEEVLIKGYKDGKAEQKSRSDTTTVQSVKQLYKEAVGTDKSEGL
jgi:hypothetical protein